MPVKEHPPQRLETGHSFCFILLHQNITDLIIDHLFQIFRLHFYLVTDFPGAESHSVAQDHGFIHYSMELFFHANGGAPSVHIAGQR